MANDVDRLRIATDLLQEHGLVVDERQLAALLGLTVRAVLWVSYDGTADQRPKVYNWALEDEAAMDDELKQQWLPVAFWLNRGWKIVPGGTPSTTSTNVTILIVEKVASGNH